MTIPAKLMEMVGIQPGEKVDLMVGGYNGARVITMKKPSGWEDLRGILRKYAKVRRYPTKEELAEAWTADYRKRWVKNAKNSR